MGIDALKMHSKCINSLDDSTLGKLMNNFEASRSAIDGDQEGERAGNGKSEIFFLRTALDMRVMLAICRVCCLCRSRQIFAFSLSFIRMLLLCLKCVWTKSRRIVTDRLLGWLCGVPSRKDAGACRSKVSKFVISCQSQHTNGQHLARLKTIQ